MKTLIKNKTSLILLSLLILSVVVGIFSLALTKHNSILHEQTLQSEIRSGSTTNTLIYKDLNSITVPSFKKMVAEKNNFIVYIGRPTCSDCNLFDPILINELKKEHMTTQVTFLNVAWERQKKWATWVQFKKNYGFEQTPALIHYRNGKVFSIIQWEQNNGISREALHLWLTNQKKTI